MTSEAKQRKSQLARDWYYWQVVTLGGLLGSVNEVRESEVRKLKKQNKSGRDVVGCGGPW